jgi:hypothetical protein
VLVSSHFAGGAHCTQTHTGTARTVTADSDCDLSEWGMHCAGGSLLILSW